MEKLTQPTIIMSLLGHLEPSLALKLRTHPHTPTSTIHRLTPTEAIALVIVKKRGIFRGAVGDLINVLHW